MIRNLDSETTRVRSAIGASTNGYGDSLTQSHTSTSGSDVPRVGHETHASAIASQSPSNVQLASDGYQQIIERPFARDAACDLHDKPNRLHVSQLRTDPIRRSPTIHRHLKPQSVHSMVGDGVHPNVEPVYITAVRTKCSSERSDKPEYAEVNFDRRPGPFAKYDRDDKRSQDPNIDRSTNGEKQPVYAELNFDRCPGPLAKYDRDDKRSQDPNVDHFTNGEKQRAAMRGDVSDLELRAERKRHAKVKFYIDDGDFEDSDEHEYEEIYEEQATGQLAETCPHQMYCDRCYKDPENGEHDYEEIAGEQAHQRLAEACQHQIRSDRHMRYGNLEDDDHAYEDIDDAHRRLREIRPLQRFYTRPDNGHESKTRSQDESMMYYY